jgi:DNA-binding response OmpR family regulator
MDGIQLARHILREKTLPIVFITAHNDDETLEEILELAPYGFIGKPFSSKDIVVTLQIAYKRYLTHSKTYDSKNKTDIDLSDIIINKKYKYSQKLSKLYDNDTEVKLNKKQIELLGILVKNINHIVHYDILVSRIWEDNDIADSALRTLIYSIRKLLPDLPIISHSKMGYMLATEERFK